MRLGVLDTLDDPRSLSTLAQRLSVWLSARQPAQGEVRVSGLQPAAGGFSNITLLGEVQWPRSAPSQQQGIVLRLQPAAGGVFADCDVARQYLTLHRLAATDVPVPMLLGLERDAGVLGTPFFVMTRVAGQVPNENPLYHLEGWFHDLDEAALQAHWFSGIDTLAAVSRVDWRALGFADLLPPPGLTPLAHQLDNYHRHLVWAESLARPYPMLHAAYRWLLAHQPVDQPLALSWGDAKLGNCVFHQGRVAAALDWEMAALSNPVDDLAWWLMLDESLSTGYGLPRLPGLPSRAQSIARWERVSGHSARDLPYYEVFAAWRFAILMARIGTLFAQRGLASRASGMDVNNGGARLLALLAKQHGF